MEASTPPSGSRAERLFGLHVRFELSRWSSAAVPELLAAEAGALYDRLGGKTLSELLPLEAARSLGETARQVVPDRRAPEEVDLLARRVREQIAKSKIRTSDLISRDSFDAVVAVASRHPELWRAVVHALVHNDIFGRFVSDLLYQGIEDFANASRTAIPGAQALFKMGQNLLNTTLPGLSEGFEKTTREFLRNNADRLAKNSEEFLNRGMRPELIAQAAGHFYEENANCPVAEAAEMLSEEKIKEYRAAFERVLAELRSSEPARTLATSMLEAVYAEFGQTSGAQLLALVGVDRSFFVRLCTEQGVHWLDLARSTGLLEERIRANLGAFYSDSATQALLDS